MSAEPTSPPDPDEPHLIDEDLPCPECEYNLRGLTMPRCPECGHRFAWTDLPDMRNLSAPEGGVLASLVVLTLLGVGIMAIIAPIVIWLPHALGGLVVVVPVVAILASFVVSGIQSLIEQAAAAAVIGLPGWRRFRAWWEGVLIGYGLGSLTLYIAGHPYVPIESFGTWRDSLRLWPWLLLVAVEAVVVQWWVVGRRLRGWGEPVPPRRLLLACLVGRAVVVVPWLYLTRHLTPG